MDHEVVFDTTANHPAIREQALALARTYRARTTLVVFTASAGLSVSRQVSRQATRGGRPVPASEVNRIHGSIAGQLARLPSEGWNRIVRIGEWGAAS